MLLEAVCEEFPMPIQQLDLWIRRFSHRIRLGAFLQSAADQLAVFLCVFGTLVLIVKLLLPSLWPHVLWCGLAAVPVTAVAWYSSRRMMWSRGESVARLDSAIGAGGLLMTIVEQATVHGDGSWTQKLPQVEELWKQSIPKLRPKRFASYVGLPLLFAVAACFVPLRDVSATPIKPNIVGQEATQQLEELLKSLDEQQVLDEKEEEELKEELEQLETSAKETPLTHEKWETVDALRERMRVRLETAEASMSMARDAAAALSQALEENGESLSAEQLQKLQDKLADAMQKLADKQNAADQKEGGKSGSKSKLSEMAQKLCKEGKCKLSSDPKERKKQLEDLKDELKKECDKLGQCKSECSGKKKCNGKGDGECESNSFSDKQGECNGNKPGRGGVSRGRADAELTWGEENSLAGVEFKESALPEGFQEQAKDEVVKVQLVAPNEQPVESAAKGAARQVDPASGQATWERKVSPRHRSVLRKYFQEK